MKILGITPKNELTGETPEETQLKNLRKLGHTVLITDVVTEIPNDIDVVVSLSEVSAENAFYIASKYNIPYYSHIEWIPYWRVGYEPESYWGFENLRIDFKERMNFIRLYNNYAYFWRMADYKTVAAECFKPMIRDFVGYNFHIGTKYLSVNLRDFVVPENVNKDNSVCCIARFVPHKRIHHIILALEEIGFDGVLRLVGYGSLKSLYDSIPINFKIEYYDSKDKFEVLCKSKVNVSIWSGLVPIEACYCNTPTISYDSPYMRELFGDTLDYAENNNISYLAIKLNYWLNSVEEERIKFCNAFKEAIINKKINTLTEEDATKQLELFILQAIKNKKAIHP